MERSRDLPVCRTQRYVHPDVQWEDHADHVVFDTPTYRGTWFGHRIEVDQPPSDLAPWFARWDAMHVGKGVGRRFVVWESRRPSPPPAGPYECIPQVGLVNAEPMARVAAPLPLRPVVTDAEWAAAAASSVAVNAGEDPEFAEHIVWLYRQLRVSAEAGRGTTWVAWDGDVAAAGLSVVSCPGEGRYQDVWTRVGYRNRGLCSALVRHAGAAHRERFGHPRLVISAETDGTALRLYQRAGFEAASWLYEIGRPP